MHTTSCQSRGNGVYVSVANSLENINLSHTYQILGTRGSSRIYLNLLFEVKINHSCSIIQLLFTSELEIINRYAKM